MNDTALHLLAIHELLQTFTTLLEQPNFTGLRYKLAHSCMYQVEMRNKTASIPSVLLSKNWPGTYLSNPIPYFLSAIHSDLFEVAILPDLAQHKLKAKAYRETLEDLIALFRRSIEALDAIFSLRE